MEPTNQNTQNSTSHHKKVFSSILIILLCLILIYSVPSLGKIKLSAFNEGIKISSIDDVCNIYSKIDLNIHTKPSDFKISKSNFVISGGSIFEENNSFYFVASEPGIYSIKIKYKQIESNELQLEFVNPIEIERKDLEQEFFYFKKDQEDFEQKVEELDEREKSFKKEKKRLKKKKAPILPPISAEATMEQDLVQGQDIKADIPPTTLALPKTASPRQPVPWCGFQNPEANITTNQIVGE